MSTLPHNTQADHHFKEAEGHAASGRPKEMWNSLGQAQKHATNHAKELAESGGHDASLAYRKMIIGRVKHISGSFNKAISDFQLTKYSALNALWETMKQNGARPYALAVPQVELAKSPSEIDNILNKYGIKLNRDIK